MGFGETVGVAECGEWWKWCVVWVEVREMKEWLKMG
ncbi:hypothetical protein A2U01_0092139, partial [Trifolium medium]|nr:hypothetical protein [Trifolium medium]